MDEKDAVFRDRLIALMSALNGGEGKDPVLRKLIAGIVHKITRDARVANWNELKARIDAATYDSLLALIQRESATYHKAGNPKGVRALEVVGLSLVAKTQRQADLYPGVGFLDRYIDACAEAGRPSAKVSAGRPTLNG